MFRLGPGDPASALADPSMGEETRQSILDRHGLNEPLHTQFIYYMVNLVQGDLGVSFTHGVPVTNLIVDRALNTLVLMLTAVVLAFLIGPFLGAYFAWNRKSKVDDYGVGLVLLMYAAPVFWVGMLGIMLFSFNLGWLPSGGMYASSETPQTYSDRFLTLDFLRHLILPLAVTTLYYLTLPVLIMRNNMIDVLEEDFMELKYAEGLPERKLMLRHGARNALLPVFHYAAVAIGFAFGGSVIIETVFSWPGLGRLMWEAVRAHDYPLAQGSFLLLATIIIVLNFVVDVLSVYLDPRAAQRGDN